ncbi:tRNA (adenine(22)-N(1))-methyltransferase [Vibrio stylophorae]|uniref:tRNA (adenine(22)-N(1))-methyltransferase n=1 Tax=Vibrio stylophorae TaxID=659351 RepID=UPI001F00F6BC|nr:tRNA (adenine(22)-N(1))-methyltransferase TrmK [Vibrio stylophorae]
MKLGKRLGQIEQWVQSHVDHIWDCCCDHGHLGAAILKRYPQSSVHFVDIVPSLMSQVESKLKRFHPNGRWQTHCLDVAQLPLNQYAGRHLVIIAGVGGDLMAHFVSTIVQENPHLTLDFLLCPVHHQYALRQQLIALELNLLDEVLVEENQRFYEILHLTTARHQGQALSITGERLWHADNAEAMQRAKRYLQKTLAHYQRIAKGNQPDALQMLAAYQAIQI